MRALVVEDSAVMSATLRKVLEGAGYAVDAVTDGQEALWAVREQPYDVVVLDAVIPPPDGFEVCRRFRKQKVWTPVLMLTGRDSVEDRVAGLDAGADDYLVKPFDPAELLARLRAISRREVAERPVILEVGDLTLDPGTREVWRGGQQIELSPKEFSLLEQLMRNAGQVLSRTHLLEHVWDFAYTGTSNVIDVYVRYLRDKVDRPFGRQSIETVRGAGYRLRVDHGV